ncbi:MAG: hypothetical protein IPO95_16605 [Rhodanobacteraceae bacterium]|nr:hypothetical protein [Rhodanobacteraceae bacterium]
MIIGLAPVTALQADAALRPGLSGRCGQLADLLRRIGTQLDEALRRIQGEAARVVDALGEVGSRRVAGVCRAFSARVSS